MNSNVRMIFVLLCCYVCVSLLRLFLGCMLSTMFVEYVLGASLLSSGKCVCVLCVCVDVLLCVVMCEFSELAFVSCECVCACVCYPCLC